MRVLLVEDDRTLARAVSRALALDGFAVDVAHDGAAGLLLLRETRYDVVVLDVMLPELSGYEVLRRLRRARVWSPVLMLTAKDGPDEIADALDLGADDYLVKPFAHVVLVARLRALVRRGAVPRPVELTVGALEIDPTTRQVKRDGIEVSLTTRQFALLEYLARHAGRPVGKAELLEHVWDRNAEYNPNLVEVLVGGLRKQIGTDAVETVRGAGYRLRT